MISDVEGSEMERRRNETYQTIVQRGRKMLEIEPDVERRCRGHCHFQTKPSQTLEDVITLVLEVPLQSDLLLVRVDGVKERDSSKLQTKSSGERSLRI